MGIFDSLGNLASRVGREAFKGIGALGEFAGNIAGGAWQSFTDPGFNLPTQGGLGGKLGGLLGEFGEATIGQVFDVAGGTPSGTGRPSPGPMSYPRGYNPDPRAQRDLEVFLGQTGGIVDTYGAPQQQGIPWAMPTLPGVGAPSGGAGMMTNVALPGGALIAPLLGQLGRGALAGAGLGAGMSLFGGGGGEALAELPFGGAIFRPTAAGIRAKSLVEVMNPVTGKKSWYRNVGRPILFSGDLRACKRVRKIAGRARRARGR